MPKPDNVAWLKVGLTPQDRELLKRLAEMGGESLTGCVRRLAMTGARVQLQRVAAESASIDREAIPA